MRLADVIRKHGLRVWKDIEVGSQRWITVIADAVIPATFGDLHRATDYTLVSLCEGHGCAVFYFQRNSKPAAKGGE
jgi:hypothetical protein